MRRYLPVRGSIKSHLALQVTLTGAQRDTLREVLVKEMKSLGAVNPKLEIPNDKLTNSPTCSLTHPLTCYVVGEVTD